METQVQYLRERSIFGRLDTFPFLVAYTVGFAGCFQEDERLQNSGLFLVPAILFAHIVLFFAQSYPKIKAFVGFSHVASVNHKATHLLVSNHDANGRNNKQDIVPIIRDKVNSNSSSSSKTSIAILGQSFTEYNIRYEHKKVMHGYNTSSNAFEKIEYPVNITMSNLREHTGYKNSDDVARADKIWGRNSFDIPLPGFLDLYVEHLVAPFFVFQVLCLFLWSLDDYWYYSIFTLCMLMFLEAMMCKQRLNSILALRKALKPPCWISVFRNGAWSETRIKSDDLHPGDIISLVAENPSANIAIPCDCLLIAGSCIVNEAMLTGESVPQIKESININDAKAAAVNVGNDESNIDSSWKMSYLYSGTKILQHSNTSTMGTSSLSVEAARDKGCIAVVVRTGFRSAQGALMRKILFSSENIHDNSYELVYFIGILVFFAAIAASVVLYYGAGDPERNKFRLVLHCIMIITSVIPPELPMELSLAVTTSLGALAQHYIFCTEPFRIAFAGKVSTLCFDKTGTLTKDEMILRGAVLCNQNNTLASDISEVGDCSLLSRMAMAACQNIFTVRKVVMDKYTKEQRVYEEVSGDPLEMAAVGASGFKFVQLENIGQSKVVFEDIEAFALRRFAFSSALKRMSVVTEVVNFDKCSKNDSVLALSSPSGLQHLSSHSDTGTRSFVVFSKGAPEILKNLLVDPPANYDSVCKSYMTKGKRVVTIAYKVLFTANRQTHQAELKEMFGQYESRESVESQLKFLGFLVFDCELKPDTKSVMKELIDTNNESIMITGDSAYTALDVAKSLKMIKNDNIAITKVVDGKTINWEVLTKSNDSDIDDLHNFSEFDRFKAQKYDFCITGDALSLLESNSFKSDIDIHVLMLHVKVFARVSPEQKEFIVKVLNSAGAMTLMCGDGTNDVGALKAAHVGVSIVNNPLIERQLETISEASISSDQSKSQTTKSSTSSKTPKKKATTMKDREIRAAAEFQFQQQDPTLVQLGDASIASPFTARRTSIDVILTILRSGRCTLVNSIQVYKVLALNCLVSAYMMSVLFLKGLKVGDIQMTAQGLMTAALFFALSQAKPLNKLSDFRPPSSVFAKSVFFSIIGQCFTHLTSVITIMKLASHHANLKDPSLSPDGKFRPNIVNSSLFLLTCVIQVNSFITNYRGDPFTMKLTDHVYLFRGSLLIYVIIMLLVGQNFVPLNDFLQLVPFPDANFQLALLGVFTFDFAFCFGIEHLCRKLKD